MRYQDDSPLEGLDRGGEAVDRVDVQVVGRLIEQQHPARLHSEHGEDEPRALAIGHQAYGRGLLLGAEAEGGEVRAPHLLAPLVLRRREGAAHEDERRGVEVEHLGRVLVVEAEREVLVLLDGALGDIGGTWRYREI